MKVSFAMPKKQIRAHVVLFCENTPFKAKRVESKIKYKRREKHSKRAIDS
jgi:hypothetical protein